MIMALMYVVHWEINASSSHFVAGEGTRSGGLIGNWIQMVHDSSIQDAYFRK